MGDAVRAGEGPALQYEASPQPREHHIRNTLLGSYFHRRLRLCIERMLHRLGVYADLPSPFENSVTFDLTWIQINFLRYN